MTRPSDPAELAAYFDVQYNARASVEDYDQYPRQSHEFLDAWTARGLPGRFVEAPGKNHFDVVLELGQPGMPLYRAVTELMGL